MVALGDRPAPASKRPIYESFIRPNEKKIIWYRKTPDIVPASPISDLDHPQGELKSAKTLIVRSPQPISSTQLVLQPSPQIKLERDLKAPNLVGFTPPLVSPPEPKQVKPFVPPPAPARPRTPEPTLNEPEIEVTWTEPGGMQQSLTLLRPKPKPFAAPPKRERAKLSTPEAVLAEPAPELGPAGVAQPPELAGLAPSTKLPPKPFRPPPGKSASRMSRGGSSGAGGSAGGSSLEAAPSLPPGSNLSAAIIGLNPTDQPGPIPPGSRPAEFSAAPRLGKAATGEVGSGIVVPGVMIKEGKGERPNPEVRPQAPPQVRTVMYDELVPGSVRPGLSAPLRPASRTIPRALEARFQGRLVYAMVIPAPNLPEYTGDWIVWFAELAQKSGETPVVRAPLPLRKTEPLQGARTASGDRSEARVQLAAVIMPDGRFDSVTLLRGPAPQISQGAIEDLKRWEFRPATRGGSPIGVEAVIEIPFSLAWLSGSP